LTTIVTTIVVGSQVVSLSLTVVVELDLALENNFVHHRFDIAGSYNVFKILNKTGILMISSMAFM